MAFSVSANVWESDVNVNNNTSKVNVSLTLNSTYGSYFSDNKTGTITIDGTSYNITYNFPSGTTSKNIGSASKVVTHNNDGSKTANWSYSIPTNSSQGTKTGSGSIGLTTIARASQPSCITYPNTTQNIGNLGDTITIHMNRKSTSFTHKVTYVLGSQSGTIATNVGDNCSWTIPLNLANSITNAKTGNGTIYAETFNGSTSIGTKSVGFSVNVPNTSTFKPTISLSATPTHQFNSKYLNKVSGVTISATNSAKYNASIRSYAITGPTKSSSNASLVANPINISMSVASQNLTITGNVTDSRGYTNSGTTSITLYRYNVPQITNFTIQRCNQNGTLNVNGTYAKASITYTYQNDGYSNSMSVKKININYTDYNLTTTETTSSGVVTGTGTTIVGGGNLSVNSHYDYVVTCTDAVGNSSTTNGTLPTSSRIINVRPGGLGISFGKFAETDNLVDSEWDVKAPNFQGTATNATNINIAQTDPTSGSSYYIPFMTGQSGNQRERANDGIGYYCVNGTAGAVGTGELRLGNSTSSGTAGNKRGHLRLMSEKSGSVYLRATAGSTAQRWVTFPDLGGTAVVKQSDAITTDANGWYKVNMGAFTLYFKHGTINNYTFSANDWGWFEGLKMPSGVTFNSAKMVATANAIASNAAIVCNIATSDDNVNFAFNWQNKSGSSIKTNVKYDLCVIVFP